MHLDLNKIIYSFQSLSCKPIASLDHFLPEALGSAELVEEVHTGPSKIVKVSGIDGALSFIAVNERKVLRSDVENNFFSLCLSLYPSCRLHISKPECTVPYLNLKSGGGNESGLSLMMFADLSYALSLFH